MPPTPFNQKVLDHLRSKYPKVKFGIEHRDVRTTLVRWWTPKEFSSVSIVKHLNKLLSPLRKVAILRERKQTTNHISGMKFDFIKVEISREGKDGYESSD